MRKDKWYWLRCELTSYSQALIYSPLLTQSQTKSILGVEDMGGEIKPCPRVTPLGSHMGCSDPNSR